MTEIDYGDPGQPFTYVFRQEVTEDGKRDGTIWTSPLMRTRAGDSYSKKREIVQSVIGGMLSGSARWAETPNGTLIYGLDRSGMFGKANELTTARRYEILKEADALRVGPRRRGPGKAKAAPKYRVVVAWLNRNYDPPKPAAAAWKSSVAESSLLEAVTSARHHAAREHTVHESALVLTFPMSEKDPLGKARAKALDVARGLGLAGRLGYESARAGEKHERGGNPSVRSPKEAFARAVEREKEAKRAEAERRESHIAHARREIGDSARRGEQPHLRTPEDIERTSVSFGQVAHFEAERERRAARQYSQADRKLKAKVDALVGRSKK